MRARRAPFRVALLALLAWPGVAPGLRHPVVTRDAMESAAGRDADWLVVYGTADPGLAARLRAHALLVARRMLDGDTLRVRADRDVDARTRATHALFLIGGPTQNAVTRALAPALPVAWTAHGFRWHGRAYERPGDVLRLVYPNPAEPHRLLLLVAGNGADAWTAGALGFGFGTDDWRITRAGELLRSGRFAQSDAAPWRYDPALDRDRERELEGFAAAAREHVGHGLVVRAAPGTPGAAEVLAQGDVLLARLDALGLGTPAGAAPTLTLYGSLEQKGALTRDTRPEHVGAGAAFAARPAGRERLDLWSVAALRLERLGAAADAPMLVPAAVALGGRFEGEPLDAAIARLYFGRALPSAAEAARWSGPWRSPLAVVPARAVLVRALRDCAGARSRAALLAWLGPRMPGTLDSACAAAAVDPARVRARYARLADSLARAGARAARLASARAWRPADGFRGGVCLAHAVSLEHGYLSAECAAELRTLAGWGATAVTLSPFGFLASLHDPTIAPSADAGPEGESDESLVEAGARARALGMGVWLAPHLWTRGWVGALEFTPEDWPKWFDAYHAFIVHYALLAEREGFEGLVVGHELASATRRDPDRWRAIIADVRRVYHGTLTYGANWDEVQGVAFWDALDAIGVSCYAPLAAKPRPSAAVLRAGATRTLDGLGALSERAHRPVLLTEIGYPAIASAAVEPWEEHGAAADPEAQRACYEALIDAARGRPFLAGAWWWKWSSGAADGGRDGFTPRGRPAQAVMARALAEWKGRAVAVP